MPIRGAARTALLLAICLGLAAHAAAQAPGDRTSSGPSGGSAGRGSAGRAEGQQESTPSAQRPADEESVGGDGADRVPLSTRLARVSKREFDLERALASARLDVASAKRRFEAAQQRLDAEIDPSDILREEVGARRLELETDQRRVRLIEERLERAREAETSWRRLHALGEEAVPPETLAEWRSEAEELREQRSRETAVKEDRLDEVRRDLEYTAEQIEALSVGSPEQRWASVRRRALAALEHAYTADVEDIEAAQALSESLIERIAVAQRELPLGARLRGAFHYLREIWNYRLTGSEPEPITLGKMVSALVIFLIGWLLARVVSRLLGSRIFPGLRMEEGAAHAFESLAFYVLLLVAFLTSLRMVDIPLTAFAVAGGALAIGIGFGSQNIVNNFISGIILLAERPIKRNDLVELEGVFGNVEQIGLRSTRVRTGDNVHIIVPNASFLERNVINWTHSNPKVRITIAVGVAYGSPTREVARLMEQAVREHPGVLPDPAPVILFMDFGDNALVFEARLWILMPTVLARLRIESEVRFRIDDLFREAGITIAFPQRDLHLDTLSPVEVRLVGEAESGTRGGGHEHGEA